MFSLDKFFSDNSSLNESIFMKNMRLELESFVQKTDNYMIYTINRIHNNYISDN